MVPKRSKTSGAGNAGSAARRRRSRISSNVTALNVTPPPASQPAPTAETDPSSDAEATSAEDTTRAALSAADVTEAIEHERVELLQVQAMLKCLYEVLLYADDDDSVMHADVAQVCARLVHESVRRLGDLLMQGCARSSSDEFDESAVSE